MPWTARDADRHVKGLTPRQKRIWARVANSALSACKKEGKSQSFCEGRALRMANSVAQRGGKATANHLLIVHTTTTPARSLVQNGKDYLICDCVMAVSGVLNGGFLSPEALIPIDWNFTPVVLNHPCDEAGMPRSARDPSVLSTCGLGQVFHARLGEGKRGGRIVPSLESELWINRADVYRCGAQAVQTMVKLERGDKMECSTAFFSEGYVENGEFEGDQYREVYTRIRPDHLALLPHDVGACSIEHGCGAFVRINHATMRYEALTPCACPDPTACHCHEGDMPMTLTEAPARGWHGFVQLLKRFVEHEASALPPAEEAPTPLIGEDEDDDDPEGAEEPDTADVPHEEADEEDAPDDEEEDEATGAAAALSALPSDEALASARRMARHLRTSEFDAQLTTDVQEMPMPATAAIKRLADALIAHDRTHWDELDREWLESLPEAKLMKMNQELKPMAPTTARSLVAVLEDVEPVEREAVEEAIKTYQARKDKLIELILANGQNPFVREELEGMKAERLEKLVRMSGDVVPGEIPQKGANYSGRRIPTIRVVSDDEEVPEPPKVLELVVERQRAMGLR